MNPSSPARQRFCDLIRQPDDNLDLAEAALCISWEDRGGSQPEGSLKILDHMAETLRDRIGGMSDPQRIINSLNYYLFVQLGFHGNITDYYAPENSFLDCVLATHTGLPIMLSLIYLEMGWRLDLPVAGVALPGHFLVRYHAPGGDHFIDPFNRGRAWSRTECEQQITSVYGPLSAAMVEAVMDAPTRHDMLVRILRNLKHTYMDRHDYPHALAAVERILAIIPGTPEEIRDRGLLRLRVEAYHQGLEDLEQYATLDPTARDLTEIQKYARVIIERIATDN